jgi:hypothetical protein
VEYKNIDNCSVSGFESSILQAISLNHSERTEKTEKMPKSRRETVDDGKTPGDLAELLNNLSNHTTSCALNFHGIHSLLENENCYSTLVYRQKDKGPENAVKWTRAHKKLGSSIFGVSEDAVAIGKACDQFGIHLRNLASVLKKHHGEGDWDKKNDRNSLDINRKGDPHSSTSYGDKKNEGRDGYGEDYSEEESEKTSEEDTEEDSVEEKDSDEDSVEKEESDEDSDEESEKRSKKPGEEGSQTGSERERKDMAAGKHGNDVNDKFLMASRRDDKTSKRLRPRVARA